MGVFLFPRPRQAVFGDRKLDFSDASWIRIPASLSAELKKAVITFAAAVNGHFPHRLTVTAGMPGAGSALLVIEPVESVMAEQQYRLISGDDGIRLSGGDEAAIFMGLQTLEQLLRQTGVFVPEMPIDDRPDFSRRGYMLDVSRCKVPAMDTVYELVDQLARLKFNQFQLYMEHTFAFAAHETVWYDSSPFTAQEIIELDQYCRERFIELVPNFNSFGHLERWLKFAEYKHLAECPDGFVSAWGERRASGGVLKPDAAGLEFLDGLYGELLPNFSSRFLNIGCDETWELGQGWSKPQCEARGKTRVYLDFLLQVAALAEKHDRTVMFWGDIILHQPELIAELPKNIIALNWGYEAKHPFADETGKFAASGVPFYVCPGTSSWNSLSGRTGNCVANLINAAENGIRNGAAGYLITDWGDGGHHQYPPVSWPGLGAGAAYSWCLEANRDIDLAEAIDLLFANDCGGVIGDYLMEFGRIVDCFSAEIHNCTVFGKALFASLDAKPDYLEEVKLEEIEAALEKTLELRGHLASALPEVDDHRLLIDELKNGSYMVEAALGKMLLMKGGQVDLQGLIELLRHIIRNHRRLWLARNREGGLYESTARLNTVLEELMARSRSNG